MNDTHTWSVTDAGTIDSAVRAGVERFRHIDVLVDNAGNYQPGFLQEIGRCCRSCGGNGPATS